MPAQTTANAKATYYSELNTAPPLEVCLKDGDGQPVDLTGATVVINIAYARYSHYYSPFRRIVNNGPCVVDPDQVLKTGFVKWTPQEGDLSPAGSFHYTFDVTFLDSSIQTFPPNTYLPMVIRTTVGGTRRDGQSAP